jgi:hypothetical protein
MDEWEYEQYLNAISEIEQQAYEEQRLIEQIRDEDGLRVPGCYYVKPAAVEQ